MDLWTSMFLLFTCVLYVLATDVTYEGHRVYSLIPRTQEQLDQVIKFLEIHPELDVWQEPRGVDRPIQVMLPQSTGRENLDNLANNGVEHKLVVPDVQRKIHEHRFLNDLARSVETHMFESYHQYDEIANWLQNKAMECGDMCEVQDIGTSFEGRPLRLIKIGADGEDKESIWVDGGIHAREWISPATAMYFVDRLIEDYLLDPVVTELVNTYDFYVLPVINPDGYDYSWTTDRTWRKTRSTNVSDTCIGVDANRNFDFKWHTIGSSSDPCRNTYAGPFALSEPEAKAQSDFMLGHDQTWKVFLTLHSFGQLWMAPWGYTKDQPQDYDKLMRAGRVAVNALENVYGTQYTLGSASSILYQSSGTSRDWAKGKANIEYVYTVELRDTGDAAFLLPPEEILPTATETWIGFRAMLEHILEQTTDDQ